MEMITNLQMELSRLTKLRAELKADLSDFEIALPGRREYLIYRYGEKADLQRCIGIQGKQVNELKERIGQTLKDAEKILQKRSQALHSFNAMAESSVAKYSPLPSDVKAKEKGLNSEMQRVCDEISVLRGQMGVFLSKKEERDSMKTQMDQIQSSLDELKSKVEKGYEELENVNNQVAQVENEREIIKQTPHTDEEFVSLYEEMRILDAELNSLRKRRREVLKTQNGQSKAGYDQRRSDDEDDFVSAAQLMNRRKRQTQRTTQHSNVNKAKPTNIPPQSSSDNPSKRQKTHQQLKITGFVTSIPRSVSDQSKPLAPPNSLPGASILRNTQKQPSSVKVENVISEKRQKEKRVVFVV